jgi:hypothetical protein
MGPTTSFGIAISIHTLIAETTQHCHDELTEPRYVRSNSNPNFGTMLVGIQ